MCPVLWFKGVEHGHELGEGWHVSEYVFKFGVQESMIVGGVCPDDCLFSCVVGVKKLSDCCCVDLCWVQLYRFEPFLRRDDCGWCTLGSDIVYAAAEFVADAEHATKRYLRNLAGCYCVLYVGGEDLVAVFAYVGLPCFPAGKRVEELRVFFRQCSGLLQPWGEQWANPCYALY